MAPLIGIGALVAYGLFMWGAWWYQMDYMSLEAQASRGDCYLLHVDYHPRPFEKYTEHYPNGSRPAMRPAPRYLNLIYDCGDGVARVVEHPLSETRWMDWDPLWPRDFIEKGEMSKAEGMEAMRRASEARRAAAER